MSAEAERAGRAGGGEPGPWPAGYTGYTGYTEHDLARRVTEPPKDPGRGEFARDRARVVHSSALRRLAAKTQVVGPDTDDFVRNRLTHSLEVAQVGRELGAALGCDPDVVDTACLAHDLGHPPFGHNGEQALDELAADAGGFEGNAQTLRLLTRLEPKVFDAATGQPAGLNLTRATLDAVTKYPWRRGAGPSDHPAGPGKFGVYPDDLIVFSWLRDQAPDHRRCVEAQVMDLADDVAYSVHDVEDAVVGGALDPTVLADPEAAAGVVARVRAWYQPDISDDEVLEAINRLRTLPGLAGSCDGGPRALAALKNTTSALIGRFVRAAVTATRERAGPGPLTRYAAEVVLPRQTRCEINTLKGIAAEFVMTAADRQPVYQRQRELMQELVAALADRAPEALEPPYAAAWREAADDACRLRAVLDQVASLTDGSAVVWHRRHHGPPRLAGVGRGR